MDLVSIIVPVYKVEEYLDKCIRSIQRQSYNNLEIILVDDGSPDCCGEICDKYAMEDRRIQVIHKENGGLGDARNAGVRKASGEYLLFIDSDDWINEKLVEHTVQMAEKTNADIVMYDYVSVESNGKESNIFHIGLEAGTVFSAKEEPRIIFKSVSAVNKLFKTAFFQKVNVEFPKGRLYEDLGTIPKLMGMAERVVYLDEILYYYLMRSGSIMHSADFSRNYKDRTAVADGVLDFYKKNQLWDSYKKELEYLILENTYFIPSKEIVLNDRKSEFLEKFRCYAYERFPNLDENCYVKELSGKDRILWTLLRKKMYSFMIALSYARRIKDSITGGK